MALIAEKLAPRAELIRLRNRAMLFGRPGAHEELVRTLVTNVGHGARRDWLGLPATNQLQERPEPRRRRAAGVGVQVAMLGVPVALAIVSLWIDQPELLPFAALWAVVQLFEFVRPGAGDEFAAAASNARRVIASSR